MRIGHSHALHPVTKNHIVFSSRIWFPEYCDKQGIPGLERTLGLRKKVFNRTLKIVLGLKP